MLSTLHRPVLQLTQARYELKQKPIAVVNYISKMAGVDHSDQLISYFPMHCKSVKWWKKKPFFHLLTTVMIQAQIILNQHRRQNGRRKMCLEDFVTEILVQLPAVDEIPKGHVAVGDKLRLTGHHFPDEIPSTQKKDKPYRNCKVCYAQQRERGVLREQAMKRRKQTRFWCADCRVPLRVVPCFHVRHTIKDVRRI